MKKKFLTFLFAICLIIPFAFMISGCNDGNGDGDDGSQTPPPPEVYSTGVELRLKESSDIVLNDMGQICYDFDVTKKIEIDTTDFEIYESFSDGTIKLLDSTEYSVYNALETVESEATPAGQYEIVFQCGEYSPSIYVVVNQTEFVAPALEWTYTEPFVFDGSEKSITLTQESIDKLASVGATITYYGGNSGYDPNSYTAIAYLEGDSDSPYYLSYSSFGHVEKEWIINYRTISLADYQWNYELDNTDFVFNQQYKEVYLVDEQGQKLCEENNNLPEGVEEIEYDNNEAYHHSAEDYVTTVNIVPCYGYIIQNQPTSLSWNIEKKEIDLNGFVAEWDYEEPFTYDYYGSRIFQVRIDNFDYIEGVYLEYDNPGYDYAARNAGEYTAKCVLTPGDDYKIKEGAQTEFTIDWEILPATYNVEIEQYDWNYYKPCVYSGEPYTLQLSEYNYIPEGITPVYTNNTRTELGTQIATLSFEVNQNFTPITTEYEKELTIVDKDFVSIKTNYIDGETWKLSDSIDQDITIERVLEIEYFPFGTRFEMTALGSYYFGEWYYSNETEETINNKTKTIEFVYEGLDGPEDYETFTLRSTYAREYDRLENSGALQATVFGNINLNGQSYYEVTGQNFYEYFEFNKDETTLTITVPEENYNFYKSVGANLKYSVKYQYEPDYVDVEMQSNVITIDAETVDGQLTNVSLLYNEKLIQAFDVYDFSYIETAKVQGISGGNGFSGLFLENIGTEDESEISFGSRTRTHGNKDFIEHVYNIQTSAMKGFKFSFKEGYENYGYKVFDEDGVTEFDFTNVEAREYYLKLRIYDNKECTGQHVEERIVYVDWTAYNSSKKYNLSQSSYNTDTGVYANTYTLEDIENDNWTYIFDVDNIDESFGTVTNNGRTITLKNPGINVVPYIRMVTTQDGATYSIKCKMYLNVSETMTTYFKNSQFRLETYNSRVRVYSNNIMEDSTICYYVDEIMDKETYPNFIYISESDDCWIESDEYTYELGDYNMVEVTGGADTGIYSLELVLLQTEKADIGNIKPIRIYLFLELDE